jgi:hypothetical protein
MQVKHLSRKHTLCSHAEKNTATKGQRLSFVSWCFNDGMCAQLRTNHQPIKQSKPNQVDQGSRPKELQTPNTPFEAASTVVVDTLPRAACGQYKAQGNENHDVLLLINSRMHQ